MKIKLNQVFRKIKEKSGLQNQANATGSKPVGYTTHAGSKGTQVS